MPFDQNNKIYTLDDLNWHLKEWIQISKETTRFGTVASYIPVLAKAKSSDLGLALVTLNGEIIRAGEWDVPFTLQSISKILGLIIALQSNDLNYISAKVDMEPTGDPFNSIARLELNQPGKPFNPLINAGAITVCSLIPGRNVEEKLKCILDLIKDCTGREVIVNNEVFISEWETANRNRSLAYFLKDQGIIEGKVDEILELYFKQCSIEINCLDLAWIGAVLANGGKHPVSKVQIISSEIARIIKSLMFTCGMYDGSGKFAVFVGIPSKSGVSGGILSAAPRNCMGVIPSGCGIGVYGPALDRSGNSIAGVELLKKISKQWRMHAFY